MTVWTTVEEMAAASEWLRGGTLRGTVWVCVFGADEEGTWQWSWLVWVDTTESKVEAEGASMVQCWCSAVLGGRSVLGESALVGDKDPCLVLVLGRSGDSSTILALLKCPSWVGEPSLSLPMISVVRISSSLLLGLGLSCVRSGLLVWTGVDGPDMSDGVEQATLPSLWTLLKDPWVM